MKREQFTEKLVRMIETIQSGALPARVCEFYVFGSYSRGALEPGDLDVVIIHDRPPRAYEEAIEHHFEQKGFSLMERLVKSCTKFRADMCRPLRKPGEKIQILLAQKLDELVGESSKIKRDDLILLWSEADQDYCAKLEAIRPDPAAGRAARDHIIELKRLHDTISTMEHTVELIRNEELVLARLPIDGIDCWLNAYHSHWLDWWTRCKVMGKDSMKLLPYAMWWLQIHRQKSTVPDSQCVVWSKSWTHRVHLGRPSLRWMLGEFRRSPKIKRQCLIPHLKSGQPNELLVFERGKNWSGSDASID
jgi:predicted nucleotidyltransferase